MQKLEEEVRALIAKSAKVEPAQVAPGADLFQDLGIDSLEGLKLLAALEKRYEITVPDHRLLEMNTLERIVDELEKALAGREVR